MKKKEFNKLKTGDNITHRDYGDCEVLEIIGGFGVSIQPLTENGKRLLELHSGGSYNAPLLETDNKLLNLQ